MRIGSGLFHAARQGERHGLSSGVIYHLGGQSSEEGARLAVTQVGLSDEKAGADISELRTLLDSWRDSKKPARQAVIRWVMRLFLSALLLGLAVKFKLVQLGQTFG